MGCVFVFIIITILAMLAPQMAYFVLPALSSVSTKKAEDEESMEKCVCTYPRRNDDSVGFM